VAEHENDFLKIIGIDKIYPVGEAMKKVLIAGESWMSFTTHVKGFDSFTTSTYAEGVEYLKRALEAGGYEVTFIPNHLAPSQFPFSADELGKYHAVILSDIGSNTLLLSDNVFIHGSRESNRLEELKKYVERGGGFLMIGGYMSFTGIDAKTRYGETVIAEILPVDLLKYDDRVEKPEGLVPITVMEQKNHAVFDGIEGEWPHFLGYNKTIMKKGQRNHELLAVIGNDPFIAVGSYGEGRTAAFTSDCAPHWGPQEFLEWKYYGTFWNNMVDWLSRVE